MITQNELKEILHYEPTTGLFTWIKSKRLKGKTAGTVEAHGYIRIGIKSERYFAHRLAWLYTHGVFPTHEIDHINDIKDDNRIVNLRDVTKSINCARRPPRRTARNININFHKRSGKFQVNIRRNNVRMYHGCYATMEEAIEVRNTALASM